MNDLYASQEYKWGSNKIMAASFTCGYCGSKVTSNEGMALENYRGGYGYSRYNDDPFGVFVCTNCHMPSFIFNDTQVPGVNFGTPVSNIPDEVNVVYEEARKAYSVGSYTGVILLCRKLLMHVGVDFGADEDKGFKYYVNFINEHHLVSTKSDKWIDSIRKFGNDSTHQIIVNSKQDAEKMIRFCEMLLKMNYEYPAMMDEENIEE